MKHTILAPILLFPLFLAGGCDGSSNQAANPRPTEKATAEAEYAEVIKVKELVKKSTAPKEVCKDVPVTEKVQPKDNKQIAGTVTGAVSSLDRL